MRAAVQTQPSARPAASAQGPPGRTRRRAGPALRPPVAWAAAVGAVGLAFVVALAAVAAPAARGPAASDVAPAVRAEPLPATCCLPDFAASESDVHPAFSESDLPPEGERGGDLEALAGGVAPPVGLPVPGVRATTIAGPFTPSNSNTLDTIISGKVSYEDPAVAGSWRVCVYCLVDIWDADNNLPSSHADYPSDWVATLTTAVDGTFSVRVRNIDDSAGVDPFFAVFLDYAGAPAQVITPAGNVYKAQTDTRWNCPTVSAGSCPNPVSQGWKLVWKATAGTAFTTIDVDHRKALFIQETVGKAWHLFRNQLEVRTVGGVTTSDTPAKDMGKAVIRFPVDSYTDPDANDNAAGHTSTTAHYKFGTTGGEIHLGSSQAVANTIAHEWGHYAMWVAYNPGGGSIFWPDQVWPISTKTREDTQCVNSFTPSYNYLSLTTMMCAWKEGWATFVSVKLTSTTGSGGFGSTHGLYKTWDNQQYNYECSGTTCSTWALGNEAESRVVATLLDLTDTQNEAGDTLDYSLKDLWTVLAAGASPSTRQGSLEHFMRDWGGAGKSRADFFAAGKQNKVFLGWNDDEAGKKIVVRDPPSGVPRNTVSVMLSVAGKYSLNAAPVTPLSANSYGTISSSTANLAFNDEIRLCATGSTQYDVRVTVRHTSGAVHTYVFGQLNAC